MANKPASALCAAVCALSLCACSAPAPPDAKAPSAPAPAASAVPEEKNYPMDIQPGEETFSAKPLTKEVIEKITGVSWVENGQVPLDALSLLTLSYVGFDGKSHTGQMIAAQDVAGDLTEIFRELYGSGFPIEKIRMIDDYGADDAAAMEDNNSSAFCYRVIVGTDILSNHSFGRAVDINPVQNPYVHGKTVDPETGVDYLDRENIRPGMVAPGGVCYNAFISRGWTWGGEWTGSTVDFQHFEKS